MGFNSGFKGLILVRRRQRVGTASYRSFVLFPNTLKIALLSL